jgi:FRG domain
MAQMLSQQAIKDKVEASQIVVKDWTDFQKRISAMTDTSWIFRGVSDPSHYLIPSIGRQKQYGHYKRVQEERLLKVVKDRAVAITSSASFDDWQWLAYAQHVGVPTRLLDWSTSPLIAAFFALCDDKPTDRLLYCVKYSTYLHEVDVPASSPFECKTIGRFSPPLAFDRLRWQRGVFTIHPEPTKIFYLPRMKIIRITKDLVADFRKKLFKAGIDYWHIYPDVHGLGEQMKWQYKNKVGLGSVFMDESQ